MALFLGSLLLKNFGPISCRNFSTESFQSSSSLLVKPPLMTPREKRVAELSDEVFSKGNVHLKNVPSLSALPEGLHSFPEICFIGKPNVGKSSIISCLLHNYHLGRSGKTRGTTRLLQFFNVGDALLLVDTPGYGGWKGRKLSQNLAERARAFGILFRYLAIRKNGPLKRVYWVMEAMKPIQPRDEEIFDFLKREQIPFSLILNKIDKLNGDKYTLNMQMNKIWEFLGSDKVPIIGVRASPKFPEECINISALQYDITYYCTNELTRLEDLTYKNFKELSYAPPSVEEINVVERRYPIESFIVPQDDNLSLKKLVSMHEEEKMKILETSSKAKLLSSKEKYKNNLLPCEKEEDFQMKTLNNDNMIQSVLKANLLSFSELKNNNSDLKIIEKNESSIISSSGLEILKRSFSTRASLRKTIKSFPNDEFNWDEEKEEQNLPKTSVSSVLPKVNKEISSSLFDSEKHIPPINVSPIAHIPPSLDTEVHSVQAINGVLIPKSMIPVSVAELPLHQSDSLERFAQLSGAGAYEKIINSEAKGETHIFLEEGEYANLPESEIPSYRPLAKKSMRKRQLDRILEKYVSRVRKERSIYMQAEGYMCPWLAGAGQPSRVTVMGLAAGQTSIGKGGSIMKGLKRTGFGGKSYSAHTLKQRGRATKKTGFWAT